MNNLYIVIVVYEFKNAEGVTTAIYDDETEKFIQDPEVLEEGQEPPSTLYHNYLQSKYGKLPNCRVVKVPINVVNTISLQELWVKDAKEKLSLEELEALKQDFQL
jgi:hypothetical protein